ncbi:hypothetical protein EI77_03068 [Prosthecobacter fusiformis]|uniref:Uncharacterized protein n=1 Tax=Prosthecobacter fusiformis TaxID=48464 RepID=A0A4R7RX10_9BACT|nr:hypothetical protein [Prosthecobacter fusiformis]TDU69415.1 hypothetical protein EI77_03068 [Prosthecobacter fusiformis]
MIDTCRFLWSRVITRVVIALLTVGVSSVSAFDPVGPPPQKTMEWTCRFLGSGRMAAANFQNASIWEAADFLSTYIPTGYNLTYNVDDALDDATRHISLDLKDPTFLEVVAEIARQSGTDVLISPGQVTFKKRSAAKATKPK